MQFQEQMEARRGKERKQNKQTNKYKPWKAFKAISVAKETHGQHVLYRNVWTEGIGGHPLEHARPFTPQRNLIISN